MGDVASPHRNLLGSILGKKLSSEGKDDRGEKSVSKRVMLALAPLLSRPKEKDGRGPLDRTLSCNSGLSQRVNASLEATKLAASKLGGAAPQSPPLQHPIEITTPPSPTVQACIPHSHAPPLQAYVYTKILSQSLTMPPKMHRSAWCLADYLILEQLYKGYASIVYKAICHRSGEVVVLKVYQLESICELYRHQILREVRLHSSLDHENIVHLYCAFQENNSIVMVQEYADGADLFTHLHKYGGRLTERLAVQLVLDPFLRVLHYLHTRGIAHRDIKPENIMFTSGMTLKLGDFGLAIDLREERAVTRAGTLDYMAPEILECPFKSKPEENKENERLHYSNRVDAWAVGILTYELLAGLPPFYDQSRQQTEHHIRNSMPRFPAMMSEDAKKFITAALQKNPIDRPTMTDMVTHPWIVGYRARRSMRLIPCSFIGEPTGLVGQGSMTSRQGTALSAALPQTTKSPLAMHDMKLACDSLGAPLLDRPLPSGRRESDNSNDSGITHMAQLAQIL